MWFRLASTRVVALALAGHLAQAAGAEQIEPPLLFREAAPFPSAVAVSGNGKAAAYINSEGAVVVWNTANGRPLETLRLDDRKASAVALNADGDLVAIGAFDASVVLWSRSAQKQRRAFGGHVGAIASLAFSYDDKLLATGGTDATAQVWDVATGRRVGVFDSAYQENGMAPGKVVGLAFSGNARMLIVNEWFDRHYDTGRATTLWELRDGFELGSRAVAPPKWSIGGRYSGQAVGGQGSILALTGPDGLSVERLDRCEGSTRSRKKSADAPARGGYADTVAADPQGRWVAYAETEKMGPDPDNRIGGLLTFVVAADVEKKKATLVSVKLPGPAVSAVPFPDGRAVLVLVQKEQREGPSIYLGIEHLARGVLYAVAVPEPLLAAPALPGSTDADGRPCASSNQVLRLQQAYRLPEQANSLNVAARLVPTPEMLSEANRSKGDPTDVPIEGASELRFGSDGSLYALHPNGHALKSGVAVWSVSEQRQLRARFVREIGSQVMAVREGWAYDHGGWLDALSGRPLLPAGENDADGHVKADPDTGHVFRERPPLAHYSADGKRLPGLKGASTEGLVDFAVRNGRLAALYANGDVRLLAFQEGSAAKIFKRLSPRQDGEGESRMELSADGRFLLIETSGEGPTRWEVIRLEDRKTVMAADNAPTPFPARANRGVIPYERPFNLLVWDYEEGHPIALLPRQRSRDKQGHYIPLKAALSDDGRRLASASYDGLVRVWNIGQRQLIGEARIGGPVTALAFDERAQQLAVAREDATVFVLTVPARP